MSIKRKNDSLYETETITKPPSEWGKAAYQFYVDVTPHEVVSHIRQLEDRSSASLTYRVTPSSVDTGTHFEVRRIESRLGSSKQMVVTGHVSPYDIDTERSFVALQTGLAGPGLKIFLGVVGVFIYLMILSASPMAPTAACTLFVLIGIPILGGIFMVDSFDSNRRQILEIVANHLMLLRKDTSDHNRPIDRKKYD